MRSRSWILGLLTVLALALPARADQIDVSTELLDDGWTRYTYTVEDPSHDGLQSFQLESAYLDELREISQPADWMYHLGEGSLSWGRDVFHAGYDCKEDLMTFSFESLALPGEVQYLLYGKCLTLKGSIAGPGPGPVTVVTTRTPEPSTLGLLALGGAGWWLVRRRQQGQREPK